MDQREGWEQRQMQGWSGANSATPSITPEQLLAMLQAAGLSDGQDTYAQIQPAQHINAPAQTARSATKQAASASRGTASAKAASGITQSTNADSTEQVPLSTFTDGSASSTPASSAPIAPSGPSLPSDITAAIAAAIAAAGGYFANGQSNVASAPSSRAVAAIDPALEGEWMPKEAYPTAYNNASAARDAASMPAAITGNRSAQRLTSDGTIKAGAPVAEAASSPAAKLLQAATAAKSGAPLDMQSYRDIINAVLQDTAMAKEVADRNVMQYGKGSAETPTPNVKPKIKPKVQQGAKAAARLIR